MNKIIIILVIFVMLFSGFTLLENSQTNNFYENNINTNNFISSNSPIYNLTIYIHNSPAGNGYYQQLFNFNSTSYFIYNLNQNASNFYISYENGTLIYSWIQNWNFTTKNLTIWSKLQNGTKVIMIEIFNQNTNLLSANGHIGEAPQYSTPYGSNDNGQYVFGKKNYTNFYNLSDTENFLNMGVVTSSYQFSNGIIFPNGISSSNPNANTIASNIQYHYGDYFGFSFLANLSTVSYARFGYGFASDSSNSYWLAVRVTSFLRVNNQTNDAPTYGSIATPNMTFVNGYTAETTAGVPFLYFNGVSVTSGTTITAVNHRAFIELYSGYAAVHYMFVASEIGSMPTYTIELNIYNINIKSFDKQSNPIHNYFFYNNSVYSANNNSFVFKNKTSFSTISLIPLNFSSYFTEYKNITISQSQFLNNNNNSYYYNLSIYYYNSNLNTVNPYDFANYIYPISILVFLLLGGIILFGTIKYRRSN